VTSVSSLGSTLTQYKSPISSLDTNGDGIVSADELAAAGQSSASASTSSTSSTDGDTTASASDLINKVKSDILSLMLTLQQQSDGSDDQSSDGSSTDDSKGIFASMDTNGDGKLTEAEFLAADPQKTAAADGSDESDPAVTGILQDMQDAILAYQNTYGASAAADTATDDVQPA
jgi:hypothetical protein